MPHIHETPGAHDVTVTGYIIREMEGEVRMLFHMHRKLKRLLPIGGHIEIHEHPWRAMAHELEEESGYALAQTEVYQPVDSLLSATGVLVHPTPVVYQTHDITPEHFHTDAGYALYVTGDPQGVVAEGESQDIRWLNRDEISVQKDKVMYDNTREIALYILDVVTHSWRRVSSLDFAH